MFGHLFQSPSSDSQSYEYSASIAFIYIVQRSKIFVFGHTFTAHSSRNKIGFTTIVNTCIRYSYMAQFPQLIVPQFLDYFNFDYMKKEPNLE